MLLKQTEGKTINYDFPTPLEHNQIDSKDSR